MRKLISQVSRFTKLTQTIWILRRKTRIQISKRKKSIEIVEVTFILIPEEMINILKNMINNPSILIGKEDKNRSERQKKYMTPKNSKDRKMNQINLQPS